MAVALIGLLFMSLVMLVANLVLGYDPGLATQYLGTSFLSAHIMLGVLASLLALFSVVITMFYFIGTAKAVEEGVRDYELDRRYYEMTLKYKKKYFPVMTVSLLVYIALPSVGAAVSANYLASWYHEIVAYLTILTHGYICYSGWGYIFENDRLVNTVDRLIREQEASPGTGSG